MRMRRMGRRPASPVLGVLAALVVWCAPAAAADAAPRIDLDFSGIDLGHAVDQFSDRTGLDVMINPDVARPEEFGRRRLFLSARSMPVTQALDWIARALGTRYRYDAGRRSVWFTSSYSWVSPDGAPVEMYTLGGLIGSDGRAAFMARLQELCKTPDCFGELYTMRLRDGEERLVLIQPPVIQQRLHAILSTLGAPPMPIRAPEADAGLAAIATALEQPVYVDYRGMSLPAALMDLAGQCGVNIAFDPACLEQGAPPKVTVPGGEMPARAALDAVCRAAGLARWVPEVPMAVWLEKTGGSWARMGSRRLIWEEAVAVSYALGPLAQDPGGEAAAHLVRRALSPDWREDAAVGVVYHPDRQALVVVGPEPMQAEVAAVLAQLAAGR